jgi:hypothetical protein
MTLFSARLRLLCWLLLLLQSEAFAPALRSVNIRIVAQVQQCRQKNKHHGGLGLYMAASSDKATISNNKVSSFALAGSAVAWTTLSTIVLSHHPDPRFLHCSFKHNFLTMAQALAFPLAVLWGSYKTIVGKNMYWAEVETRKRVNLGLIVSHLYLIAATGLFAPAFACGYDLVSTKIKLLTCTLFASTTIVAWRGWTKRTTNLDTNKKNPVVRLLEGSMDSLWSIPPNKKGKASLYATATIGLLWFSLQPLYSEFPLATIPSILGKRLSRAASAFYMLGAVQTYCLKEAADNKSDLKDLKLSLGAGSLLHLVLIALKLIGVDDGGFLFPGRGLWELYPAMLAVPFATTASCLVHLVVCVAAFG